MEVEANSPLESTSTDWVLCNSSRSSSPLFSTPVDLINPQLQDALPLSILGLSPTTDSVVPITCPGYIENKSPPLSDTQSLKDQPVVVDAKDGQFEVEALLAKWTTRGKTWYLVKWKGCSDAENSWGESHEINSDIIKKFEQTFQGNHTGVQLLKKRRRRGKSEYFVEWKGRPSPNTWEKAATISRERVLEFEES